ncbi:SsrA-binding protein SmpB [Candidatus Margulisiibacteriota bacterium]
MEIIAHNRKALHNYEILEKYEAGIMLEGMEVKSIRARQLDIKDAYALIKSEEIWLMNMYIKPYDFDGRREISPTRSRKLLLNKREIRKLEGKVAQKGFTVVPLKVYLSNRNLVKVGLGLGKAKKLIDKREVKKQKDLDRDMQREINKRG